jgi:hypothetical protein
MEKSILKKEKEAQEGMHADLLNKAVASVAQQYQELLVSLPICL